MTQVADFVTDVNVNGSFPTRVASRVTIVGFADSSRPETPYGLDDMEYWGLNRLHAVVADGTWTRWFQIHDFQKHHGSDAEHGDWLRAAKIPVYLRTEDIAEAGIPNAAPFPKEALLDYFGPYAGGRYFTNSVSWLLGLAIAMGFEEIRVYGVDMAQDTVLQNEYSAQRPSCEYFLGVAEGRGIRVVIPDGADLLKATHLYGFDDGASLWYRKIVARLQELGTRKEQVKAQIAQLQAGLQQTTAQLQHLDGAMQQCEYELKNWLTPRPDEGVPDA